MLSHARAAHLLFQRNTHMAIAELVGSWLEWEQAEVTGLSKVLNFRGDTFRQDGELNQGHPLPLLSELSSLSGAIFQSKQTVSVLALLYDPREIICLNAIKSCQFGKGCDEHIKRKTPSKQFGCQLTQ